MTEPGESVEPRRRIATLLGGAVALHVALLSYFTPRGLLFSGKPIFEYDYGLHAYQVDRAADAFRRAGHLWGYDPFMLAGQPANIDEDATNKMLELFVIGASRVGANPWVAFNVYVFLLHLSVPVVGWSAARIFGSSRTAAGLTAILWVLLWHFDSFLHWCWYVGMVAWGGASALIVLAVALMYRALRDRRTVHFGALVAVSAFVSLLHPFSVVTLLAPLGVMYRRAFRILSRKEHAVLLGGAAAAASTTLVWIGPIVQFRRYLGDVDAFLWPSLRYVLFDWFDMLKDVLMTGQPVRTAFRTLVFTIAAMGLVRLRRDRDDRFVPLATLVLVSIVFAYGSGYSSVLRQTQPYRNIGPATLAAALVAAAEVPLLLGRAAAPLTRDGRAMAVLGAALVVPGLVKTCLGYLPTAVPDRPIPRSALRPGPIPGVSNDEYPPAILGHSGPPPEYAAVAAHLDGTVGPRGRAVVFDWVLGEYLATFSKTPILGGIPQRNVPQVAAHPQRHDFAPSPAEPDPFRTYLDEYAVGAVVTTGERSPVDDRSDLLVLERTIGDHRVYRTRAEPSYFELGGGRVTSQSLNLVRVEDAVGPTILLRFHFWPTLTCKPACRVERAPSARDAAGFIRIENPPPVFEIRNDYGPSVDPEPGRG